MQDFDSIYNRSRQLKNKDRTFVPGIYREMAEELMAEEAEVAREENKGNSQTLRLQQRRIVGVLFSVSGNTNGEIFPVYLGRNVYGSDPDCDICLREATVSGKHGILLTRKLSDPQSGKDFVKVTLSDNDSEYGTSINGERFLTEIPECHDGDLISIGRNYEFILSIFDQENRLYPNTGFQRLPEHESGVKNMERTSAVHPSAEEGVNSQFGSSQEESDEVDQESPLDFYKPTKKPGNDHYNSQTIIL